jgi:excisionase family DNA binding protein
MLRMEPPAYLTTKEVALELRQHPETIRRKIREGVIPAVRTGEGRSAIRVDRLEFEAWLYSEPPSGARGATGSTGAAVSPRCGLQGEA